MSRSRSEPVEACCPANIQLQILRDGRRSSPTPAAEYKTEGKSNRTGSWFAGEVNNRTGSYQSPSACPAPFVHLQRHKHQDRALDVMNNHRWGQFRSGLAPCWPSGQHADEERWWTTEPRAEEDKRWKYTLNSSTCSLTSSTADIFVLTNSLIKNLDHQMT